MSLKLDKYGREQESLVDAFEAFSESSDNNYMENKALLDSIKILRNNIFDLSYSPVSEKAIEVEKELCPKVSGKWDVNDNTCLVKRDI